MSEFDEFLNSTLPDEPDAGSSEATDEADAEVTAAEAAPVESEQPAEGEGEASEARRVLLREVLPEDVFNELPETLRDADIAALVEDRKKAWAQAHKAGLEKNQHKQLQSRVNALERVIDFMKSQGAQPQQGDAAPAQQPSDEVAKLYQQYGVDPETGSYMDPKRFFVEVLPKISVDLARREIQTETADLREQVKSLMWNDFVAKAKSAHAQAYGLLRDNGMSVDKTVWENPTLATLVATQMQKQQLDPRDPTSHVEVARQLGEAMPWLFPKAQQAPTPAPAAQPAAEKPKHENPPHATAPKASGEPKQQPGIRKPDGMSKREFDEVLELGRDIGLTDKSIQQMLDEGPARRAR